MSDRKICDNCGKEFQRPSRHDIINLLCAVRMILTEHQGNTQEALQKLNKVEAEFSKKL